MHVGGVVPRERGQRGPVDDFPPGGVDPGGQLPPVHPPANRVVADPEQSSCFGHPKLRHEKEDIAANAEVPGAANLEV
ncbi:hypothetical protein JCM33774_77960 [Actinophytocola sp. KF-1]